MAIIALGGGVGTNYTGAITVNSGVELRSQTQGSLGALGGGTFTLNGGIVSQYSGSWAWSNNIAVTAASVIGNQSSNGLGRSMKLLGNLTSSNSSGLTFTNFTTGGTRTDDVGFILANAGANTYTTTTISANSRVRVGGNATNSFLTTGCSDAGTLGSLGTGDVTLSATTSELAFTWTDAHTVANKITGSGTVQIGGTTTAMAGTSTQVVTLSGANDYTGATTIKNGTAKFAKEISLYNNTPANWTAANFTVYSGATAAFNVGGTGEFTSSDIDTLKGLSNVASGTPATQGFKSGSILGLDTTNASGGNFAYSSSIADHVAGATTDTLGLIKLGTGTLTLSGANTFTGQWQVNAGTVDLATGGSWNGGALATSRALDIGKNSGDNGTFTVSGGALNLSTGNAANGLMVGDFGTATFNQSAGTVTVGSSGVWIGDGSTTAVGTMNLSGGTFTSTGATTVVATRGTGTINVSGTANVTLATLQLCHTAGSAQTATVNLDGGTLAVSAVTKAIGVPSAGTGTFNFNGGTLKAGAASTTFMTGLSAANVKAGGAKIDISGFNITIGQALLHDSALGATADGGLTLNNSGAAATLTLSGANSYTGGTTVNAGTLLLSGSGTPGATTGALTVGGGTLDLGTTSQTVGAVTLGSGSIIGSGALTGSSYDVRSGTISALLAGSGALNKTTTGTVTLSGANTGFSGTTTVTLGKLIAGDVAAFGSGSVTVNGGTLDLNSLAISKNITLAAGTIVGSSLYTGTVTATGNATLTGNIGGTFIVNNSQTLTTTGSTFSGILKGTGTISGPVTVTGVLAPGNSPGVDGFSDLNLSGGTYQWEFQGDTLALRGTDYDGSDLTGALTLGGSSVFQVINYTNGGLLTPVDYTSTAWNINREFLVISGATGRTGTFATLTDTTGASVLEGAWGLKYVGNDVYATWTAAVPEPGTLGLLALGALALLGRRRRK